MQTVRVRVGRAGICEWVPDHTIPSPGAVLRQTLTFELAAGATLLAIDAGAAGRIARGEAWTFARLESALTVRDATGEVLHDRFVLDGRAEWGALGFAEGRPYFASVVDITDRPHDGVLAELPSMDAIAGVARLPRRGALVRCLAPSAPALTAALPRVWSLARRALLDLPPLGLRMC